MLMLYGYNSFVVVQLILLFAFQNVTVDRTQGKLNAMRRQQLVIPKPAIHAIKPATSKSHKDCIITRI